MVIILNKIALHITASRYIYVGCNYAMRKNKFIKTEHIFLDSSIFEEQNFTAGTKIHNLFSYAKIGVIQIHITTISKRELFNRIDKRINQSKSELRKLSRNFNSQNLRVIRNLGFYRNIDLPKIDKKEHSKEIKIRIDRIFKNSNVNTINSTNLPITQIVENYYKRKPPFHNSGKPCEFIDAFILSTIDRWAKNNKTKMYVLSKDKDFLDYDSDNLILTDNLSELLENISKYYNKRYKLKKITSTRKKIKDNKKALESLSKDLINEKVSLSSKLDISDYKIHSNKLVSHKIISFLHNRTEIECIFKTTLSFLKFEDSDFREIQPKQIKYDIEIPIYLEIKENGALDIKWIVEDMYLRYEE